MCACMHPSIESKRVIDQPTNKYTCDDGLRLIKSIQQAQAACRELWMRLNALNVFGPRYICMHVYVCVCQEGNWQWIALRTKYSAASIADVTIPCHASINHRYIDEGGSGITGLGQVRSTDTYVYACVYTHIQSHKRVR